MSVGKGKNAVSDGKCRVSPPHDLPLNLDLYNYDSPDAKSCPYVLTSPRSLEACSRVGIKPVDLLHKTLEEFSEDIQPGKTPEEVSKLYDEHEKRRITLLEKCQAERDFIIWRISSKQRSQSVSPCRRKKLYGPHHPKDDSNDPTKGADDNFLSPQEFSDGRHSRCSRRARSSSTKNRNPRPTCYSTPSSPYFRGSSNLFVRITSPVVCAKLQHFPRNKMRLPPKDMKILEVILQKYEKQEEDSQRHAKAMRIWDKEKEERDRRKEKADMERWKNLALRQRSSSEERVREHPRRDHSNQYHTMSLGSPQDEQISLSNSLQKSRSFKVLKSPKNLNFSQSFDSDDYRPRCAASERVSRYDAEQILRSHRLREQRVEKRRQEILHKRDEELRRSAEELSERMKNVKSNQQELNKAMEKWQKQIVYYQYSTNVRATEKVAEIFEQRRMKIKQDRLARQAEHKKKMQRLEAEEFAKLQEMMEKLRSKDERCKAFVQEKNATIEQSRQLALAASDLRDLIRQRLDKASFLKHSQKAMLESRLQQIEPRVPKKETE